MKNWMQKFLALGIAVALMPLQTCFAAPQEADNKPQQDQGPFKALDQAQASAYEAESAGESGRSI